MKNIYWTELVLRFRYFMFNSYRKYLKTEKLMAKINTYLTHHLITYLINCLNSLNG